MTVQQETALGQLRERLAALEAEAKTVQPRIEELNRLCRERQDAILGGKRVKPPHAEANERVRLTAFQARRQDAIQNLVREIASAEGQVYALRAQRERATNPDEIAAIDRRLETLGMPGE